MALPVQDEFDLADLSPLSSNWITIDGQFQIENQRAVSIQAQGNIAYWSTDAFHPDHYAIVSVYRDNDAFIGGPAVRLAATRGYLLTLESSSQVRIQRLDSDESYTDLLTISGLTIASGDRWMLAVRGTELSAYQWGTLVGSVMDATYTDGAAGMYIYNTPTAQLAIFQADNVSTSSPVVSDAKILVTPAGWA